MSANLPLNEDELHAYADNQLAPARAEEVAAALSREPALAARVAEIRRQNALLRDAFDPSLAEPLPRKLLAAATGRAARWSRWLPSAALAASLVIGVSTGSFGRGEVLQLAGTPVTFPRQAALTHALYPADPNPPVAGCAAEEPRIV